MRLTALCFFEYCQVLRGDPAVQPGDAFRRLAPSICQALSAINRAGAEPWVYRQGDKAIWAAYDGEPDKLAMPLLTAMLACPCAAAQRDRHYPIVVVIDK